MQLPVIRDVILEGLCHVESYLQIPVTDVIIHCAEISSAVAVAKAGNPLSSGSDRVNSISIV